MNDPLWYKDAIIYEAHVRSFFDSSNDGIGDFPGLTQKLPYLRDLGINCIWLLPFYPSPLRDEGYDISDYTAVNPMYGTLDDFQRFVHESHGAGIRVMTELVVNHTSDQHPWFQRARRAPKGSPERDWYVWSDTDAKYAGTRIIFIDAEKSNWTYDAVAGQYYWHRFFSHQPDLNWDNPEVMRELVAAMRFWLDLGVDALRLDAVPYLIEREGTINENLSETHAVLKEIRRRLDEAHPGRVLLAEANQWPPDVRPYFGDGDECHMAFHFPLMPRMFMAVRQEERHPIVEIMRQTPEIPETCQWALFLRNHDELTLEMVTDEERDYMYAQYAADPQMRLNLGIRRRLAPLMEFSRRRIELMNSLLFSMPGTPIIYYGDELGMSDNVYLGDRAGVRTPMQWSSDRNGGFSRADPARLFLPANMDPIGGYDAVNAEAQERSPFSLLNWMKRLIALRRQHQVFSRGTIEFLPTTNRKVLTYVRRHGKDLVLCVANLARTVQPVEVDLSQFAGLMPVEMLGQTEFPRIGELPYFLTLAPYGFYWFQLQEAHTPITARTAPVPEEHAAVPALFAGVVWESLLDGSMRAIVERQALAPFLARQRWFGGKARAIGAARFRDWAPLRQGPHPSFLAIVEAEYRDGGREHYVLPLAMASGAEAERVERDHPTAILTRISGARKGILFDGLFDDATCAALLAMVREDRDLATRDGRIEAQNLGITPDRAPAEALAPIARSAPDQSNTSVLFGRRLIMKLFRRIERGPNPDVEIGRYLTARNFARVPPLVGAIEYVQTGEEPASIGMVQEFVRNQGNGWQQTIDDLGRYFERRSGRPLPRLPPDDAAAWLARGGDLPDAIHDAVGTYLNMAEVLGRRTGELHVYLASAPPQDEAFAPEELSPRDVAGMAQAMERRAREQFALLEQSMGGLEEQSRDLAAEVLTRRDELVRQFEALGQLRRAGRRIRCHGDYHLGQVLIAEGDIVILDFEGEPARPIAERRAKCSPLRDVAGMLRSFSYAALTGLGAATAARPEDHPRLAPWADLWERWVSAVFLRAYLGVVRGSPFIPSSRDNLDLLLQAFILDKALYELAYELNNRPEWVHIPLSGLLRLRSPLHA